MLTIIGESTLTDTIDLPLRPVVLGPGKVQDPCGTKRVYTVTLPDDDAYERKALVDGWATYDVPRGTFQVGYQGSSITGFSAQVIDDYRYQRELSLLLGWEPGESRSLPRQWRWSAYKHPFRPSTTGTVSRDVAQRFLAQFVEIAENYTSLLFNAPDDKRPGAEGFVQLHELLLHGAELSVKLLG